MHKQYIHLHHAKATLFVQTKTFSHLHLPNHERNSSTVCKQTTRNKKQETKMNAGLCKTFRFAFDSYGLVQDNVVLFILFQTSAAVDDAHQQQDEAGQNSHRHDSVGTTARHLLLNSDAPQRCGCHCALYRQATVHVGEVLCLGHT